MSCLLDEKLVWLRSLVLLSFAVVVAAATTTNITETNHIIFIASTTTAVTSATTVPGITITIFQFLAAMHGTAHAWKSAPPSKSICSFGVLLASLPCLIKQRQNFSNSQRKINIMIHILIRTIYNDGV